MNLGANLRLIYCLMSDLPLHEPGVATHCPDEVVWLVQGALVTCYISPHGILTILTLLTTFLPAPCTVYYREGAYLSRNSFSLIIK